MKRKIEFRGKRSDTGEWVYGDLIQLDDKQFYIAEWTNWAKVMQNNSLELEVDEVIPETIGQFTGLKDKNGVKIYEGDISKIKINIQGGRSVESINKVIYDKGSFHYENIKAKRSTPMFGVGYACDVEVVDNIYDNPEMLEI